MSDAMGSDRQVRDEAVDPLRSFIVQAPAGSGKTSLLTQRFLRLLSVVEQPEEIIAITFTRKAAAEMRHRIVEALEAGTGDLPPGASAHERQTWQLASRALAHGRRLGWDLDRHPSRLQIQTIDGLNHWLSRRLPLSARLGLSPRLLDDARPAQSQAARRFVARIEEGGPLDEAIGRVARLLDHDPGRLADLLTTMLGRRELWLPKLLEIAGLPEPRAEMERLLASAVAAELTRIRSVTDIAPMHDLVGILSEAAAAGPDGPLAAFAGMTGLPPAAVHSLEAWQALASAVLTRSGTVRKRVNRNDGFPPEPQALKQRMLAALAAFGEDPDAVAGLAAVAGLPPPRYSDEQWERISALREILIPAAAELQAVFAETGQLDHAAVAAAAREALGAVDAPSELALALEYRIRHVLVDEYQDTSPVQQSLLERLVAGWQPGDGHTLFCVGDPMQSIYGFREADVTLFLEAQARGIAGVPLESLTLSLNFRSCRALVDWVNGTFRGLMPPAEDYERGAVCYSPSTHSRADEPDAGATLHALLGRDPEREADLVADLVERALGDAVTAAGTPEDDKEQARTVAVLVRSRSVLPPILEALRRRGIDYRGVELEGLSSRSAVRDLLALTRALLHPGDRTAWLAVLRAPLCGLTLADLHVLAAPDGDATLWSRIVDPAARHGISDDGQARLARVLPALEAGLGDVGRDSLGSVVRAAWLALGGPATLADLSDLDNAESCFDALDALAAETRGLPSPSEVEAAVERLMASPVGKADARVQLMTIHKAKGLEFDTVIVPGLERTVPSGERQLLYWAPVAVAAGVRGIVLASRSPAGDGQQPDALERWMKGLESARARYELGRVAYVAATRARRCLHLVGSLAVNWHEEDPPTLAQPDEDSLLGFFWPAFGDEFRRRFERDLEAGRLEPSQAPGRPRLSAVPVGRLPAGYRLPERAAARPAASARRVAVTPARIRPEFDWAGEEAIAVGVVVHAELERMAREAVAPAGFVARPAQWRAWLGRLGLPEPSRDRALARIVASLDRLASSPLAARLLDPASEAAASELALTAVLDGEIVGVKIDRTFVDEAGTRWIVDWKTSSHEGAGLESFLDQELERYTPQLERYSRVMALHDPRPQRVGLYFPLLDTWRGWTPAA